MSGERPLRIAIIVLTLLFLVYIPFVVFKVLQRASLPQISLHNTTVALLLSKKNPIPADAIKIMPLGDSITMGVNSSDLGGYRVTLWSEIESAGWHVAFVGSQTSGPPSLTDQEHEGHPGWRIDQLSSHIVSWLEAYQPQIILLHIGTNDFIQNHQVSTAPARLNYLITQITTTLPHAIVIVAQITPLGTPRLNAEVVTYNKAIPPMVRLMSAQGKHVSYVDMYDAVPLKDISDHIHPNDSGYALMAHVWYTALGTAIPTHG